MIRTEKLRLVRTIQNKLTFKSKFQLPSCNGIEQSCPIVLVLLRHILMKWRATIHQNFVPMFL